MIPSAFPASQQDINIYKMVSDIETSYNFI